MTKSEAISMVFITAFKTLPRPKRILIIEKLLMEEWSKEDAMDILTFLKRRREKSLPYRRVHQELKRTGKV